MSFGKEFRKNHFLFDPEVVPLNHGSFGAIPDSVYRSQREAQEKTLKDKERFYLKNIFKDLPEFRKILGSVVDAEPNNISFVTNATTGINAILRSWPFNPGDKILYTSVVYGSCENTIKFLKNRSGIESVVVSVTSDMSQDEIVESVSQSIDAENPVMAMFDVVTSTPALRIPWERLVEVCRKKNVLSLVDGAHGIGMIPISLNTVKPDFFTTNLHKWFFTPNSCAMLYVDPKHFKHIHTFPISHSYVDDNVDVEDESRRFIDRFDFVGTVDYSAIYAIPAAYKFINDECGGLEKIREYNLNLAKQVGELVSKEFGTEYIQNQDHNMVNVRIPYDIPVEQQREAVNFMLDYQLENTKTFVHLVPHNGKIWSRWSTQIYLELEDFKYGIEIVREAIDAWKSRPHGKVKSFLNSVEKQ